MRARNPFGGAPARLWSTRAVGPRLLLVGDRQTLASLGSTALEYDPPVLGCHADPEAVGLLAAPGIRLKCALSLHARLYESVAVAENGRNPNTNCRSLGVSKDSQVDVKSVLQSRVHPV